MGSLKFRLVASIIIVLTSILAITGWFVFKSQQQQMMNLYDASLEATSLALTTKVVRNTNFVAGNFKKSNMSLRQWGFDELTIEVIDVKGKSIYKNRKIEGVDLVSLKNITQKKKWFDLTNKDGTRYRVMAMLINMPNIARIPAKR